MTTNAKADIAKLFKSGRSQAVRLPKAYRFEATEVRVRKEGDRVILQPMAPPKSDYKKRRAELDALGARDFLPDRVGRSDLLEPRDIDLDLPE